MSAPTTRQPIVLLGLPTYRTWEPHFGLALVKLIAHCTAFPVQPTPDGPPAMIAPVLVTGTLIHAARQHVIREAKRVGADWILWIDADQTFPKDLLHRMLTRAVEHDAPVLAANIRRRHDPYDFVAVGLDGEPLRTLPSSTGIEEASFVGFGVTLTRVDIFPDPNETSWFDTVWSKDQKGKLVLYGEDYFFCARAYEAGHRIYVDHDVSKDVKHLGSISLGVESVAVEPDDRG